MTTLTAPRGASNSPIGWATGQSNACATSAGRLRRRPRRSRPRPARRGARVAGARDHGGRRSGTQSRMVSIRGEYLRADAIFRRRVGEDGLDPEAGRYHLYVALACPWSHRAVIVRRLKGLEDAIGISYLHPFRDERGWASPGGRYTDDVNGFDFLAEAYDATDPAYGDRISVPVLWDKQTATIVNNESAEIIRMLGSAFDAVAAHPELDLYPEPLREEIDALNEWIYRDLNNGVYRAGFSRSQDAYETAFDGV